MKKFLGKLGKVISAPIKLVLGFYSEEMLAEAEKNGADYIVTLMQETSDYNEF